MRFRDLVRHLESAPGIAGVARTAWRGECHVTQIPLNGFRYLYLVIGVSNYMYAFSAEDAMADDWETV